MRKIIVAVVLFVLSRIHYTATADDLLAVGDSVTASAGAGSVALSWGGLLASHDGLKLVDLAYGSAGVADYAIQIYPGFSNSLFGTTSPATTLRGQKTAILAGYNDMRDWGTSTVFIEHFSRTLDAVIGWVSIPDSEKILGLSAATVGRWNTLTNLGGIGIESFEAGATVTISVTGTCVYVTTLSRAFSIVPFVNGKSGLPTAVGGEFGVTIDGVQIGKISCHDAFGDRKAINGADANIPVAVNFAPHLTRFAGLKPGRHQITLTVISNSTPATFLWAASNEAFNSRDRLPEVRVGQTLPMTLTNYVAHSIAGSDRAVALFNDRIAANTAGWFGDGAAVVAVPMASYDPATMITPDGVHPAQSGHRSIAFDFTSPRWAQLRISLEHGLEAIAAPGSTVALNQSDDLSTWQPTPFAAVSLLNQVGSDFSAGHRAFRISK